MKTTWFLLRITQNPKELPVKQKGFALLISLSAVVLLTILILAFFSRAMLNRQISFSSTNQVKADMLCRTALDIITGELRQEALNAAATPDPNDGSIPSTQGVVNPDTETGAYTIAKVSANGAVITPGGPAFGSMVALDMKSLNGRRKSNWFKSGPGLGSADLPTWAYVTRAKGIKVPALADAKDQDQDDYVVGRFAYTVYDTSGMLDANVAGYPGSLPFATPATNFGTKASTTYADLSVLGMTPEQIDTLVSWRNASLAASTEPEVEKAKIYDEWATGIPRTSGTPNAEALQAARSGHLELAAGNNAFFSRREVLRFAEANGLPEEFPASLIHISRTVNIPSWGPANVAGSSIAYADDADDSDSANRYLPNVMADEMTVRYYRDDGTYESVWIEDGDTLVTRRFSLAKLAWIGHDGPNTVAFHSSLSAAERERAIKTCFGLVWNDAKKRWDYNHGDAYAIFTLDDVRKQKRQPDFFELLKAGILRGSLGGHPGLVAANIHSTNSADHAGPLGRDFGANSISPGTYYFSADQDRHILQIGANVIDQADADNYPTAVYQRKTAKYDANNEEELYHSVFGVENLPVLARLGVITSMMASHIDPMPPGPMGAWIQPELWNPHESSSAGVSPTDPKYPTPAALRMYVLGRAYVWNNRDDPNNLNPAMMSPVTDFGRNPGTPKTEGIICFKNPGPASTAPKPFFNNPIGINGLELASADLNYYDETSPSGPDNRYPQNVNWVGNNAFLGVWIGQVHADPETSDGFGIRVVPVPYLTFVLEYYDGSSWRPYSVMSRMEEAFANGGGSNSKFGNTNWFSHYAHIDPRTDRFSASMGGIAAGQNPAWARNNTVRSQARTYQGIFTVGAPDNPGPGRNPVSKAMPRTQAGFTQNSTTTAVSFGSMSGYLLDDWMTNLDKVIGNLPVSVCRYQDPDGVTRPGDAWRADFTTGDGVMTYHQDAKKAAAGPSGTVLSSVIKRRPIILNRPFRSVGELGYVFRDQPFKTLDFWSDQEAGFDCQPSADAGLLDIFCVSGVEAAVSAGKVNPNAAPPKVMQALLVGANKQPGDPTSVLSLDESAAAAQAIADEISSARGPLANPADLVTRLGTALFNALSLLPVNNTEESKPMRNKGYAETPVRALSGVVSTRVWNLLIDVAAQSGRIGAKADGLEDFIVEGEKRYWLHLAIDRHTGEIIDSQLEPFYE